MTLHKVRMPRTKPSPPGNQIRTWAAAYTASGQVERAEGLLQAAEYVDGLALPASVPIVGSPRDRIIGACNLLRDALVEALGDRAPAAFVAAAVNPIALPRGGLRPMPALLETPPKRVPAEPTSRKPSWADVHYRVLAAIAQRSPASRVQVSVHTGAKRRRRDAVLQELQAAGYVATSGASDLVATEAGRGLLAKAVLEERAEGTLPIGQALAVWWLGRLREEECAILKYLLDRPSALVPRAEITGVTGQKRRARDAHIARLVGHSLVQTGARGIELTPAFRDLLLHPKLSPLPGGAS